MHSKLRAWRNLTNDIIILVITFTQVIYNYKPETVSVSSVHSIAAVLYLQFMLYVMLFRQ
jgi:hypothetical protein